MEYATIKLTLADNAATIRLNRPDKMNALNSQMRAELTHAIKDMSTKARVIVLTGEGPAFCSGQDLGDGKSIAPDDLPRILEDEYVPMLNAIYDCPVPVIAAVNGAAAGAGANLALACDVVIAAESAVFIQAFTRIGLMPDAGGTWFLPRQIGMAKAMGSMLFADTITARKAADWGMIYEAISDEGFEAYWQTRIAQLASGPTEAYRSIKQAVRASYGNTVQEQLLLEAELQGVCGKTTDFKEGVMAFLEKRPAKFQGK
ncbi:enoyl-CoA hydratase-related protein [Marivivens aquimaris]|uniref:enoyl-CoA hydratase-related protein n=1 Tax=Marivivens aquimaris TaxID=2774876 RepID=UPI001882C94A|nr:enoyl-CoA hydratase-related protein [Marivivens aquimaris]